MALREEVFKSKVLQKLYPLPPKLDKEPSPPCMVETLAKKTCVRRNPSQDPNVAGEKQCAAVPPARVYTVLPPPPDYQQHLETSVTLPLLESINNANGPADESTCESNNELEEDEEHEEQKRKRGRRKRKQTLHKLSGQDGAAGGSESGMCQDQTEAVLDEGEHISKNKKRKLKKKRRKEKLRSMGMMPQAAALVFTYKKEEEEEDNEKKAAEVTDFLRTTLQVCMSDSHLHMVKSNTLEDLLGHISSGCKTNATLKQLYCLMTFVQQKEIDKLEKALEELPDHTGMSADETAAVVSLFQYWITDIFPMQQEKETGLSISRL